MAVAKPREKWRILLVEDEADLRKLIVRALEQNKFEVMVADDGRAGLELAQGARRPHLIVTDIMMPNMDGLEMVRQLKQQPKTTDIAPPRSAGAMPPKAPPVIFLTAKDTSKDVIEGIRAGARHYLTKPFSMKELIDKIRAILPDIAD